MPKVCNADFRRRVLGPSPKTSHAYNPKPVITGVFRGGAPKQTEKNGGVWGGRKTRSAGVSFLPKTTGDF